MREIKPNRPLNSSGSNMSLPHVCTMSPRIVLQHAKLLVKQQPTTSNRKIKKDTFETNYRIIVGYLLFNPLRGEPLSCLVEMSKPVYIPPHRRGEVATVTGSECASQSLHSSTRQLFSDVLVINLKRRGDRLKRFTRSATRAFGTACWSRFDAIDGSTDEAARDGAFTTAWDATQNASYDRHVAPGPRRASAGERGCALSHVGIWRTVAASSTSDDDWTLVGKITHFPTVMVLSGCVMVAFRLLWLSGVETISPFCGALDYGSVP